MQKIDSRIGSVSAVLEPRAIRTTWRSILLLVFTALSFFITQTSYAQSAPGRFAEPREIVGFWQLSPISNFSALNKTNPWPQPYQWFGFYDDGTMVSMQSTQHREYSAAQLDEAFQVLKSRSPTYKWDSGMLVVSRSDVPGYREVWGVNIFTKSVAIGPNIMLEGELLMSLAGPTGTAVYYRHLRRVK